MSNDKAVATIDEATGHIALVGNEERLQLVKDQLCSDATPGELMLFANMCDKVKLDPFAKQIYITKYRGKMTIITAIDGFRVIAERSGQYAGQEGPYWYDKDTGKWTDVWCDKAKKPAAAKVIVIKVNNGIVVKTPAVAHMHEYDAKRNKWIDMPALMLAKCAEALALRKAFPNDLNGLYTADEMEQAGPVDDPENKTPKSPTANAVDDINSILDERERSGDDDSPVPVQTDPPIEAEVIDVDGTPVEDAAETAAKARDEEDRQISDEQARQISENTALLKQKIDSGDLNIEREASKMLFVDIMRARGFDDKTLAQNFRVHIQQKYRAEEWNHLDDKQRKHVIEDAIKGEVDFPIPF